jgi:hypothetical protein
MDDLEKLISERDELLRTVERLNDSYAHHTNGEKGVVADQISAAMNEVTRIQKLIDELEAQNASRP